MRMSTALKAAAIVLGSAVFGASLCHAAPDPAQPIHTNKKRFKIPFKFDAREMQRFGAKEIRLYVSVDSGRGWTQAQAVQPAASGRFDVVAPKDGEYWFAVRTLDMQNRLHPQGAAIVAGLKVVVDTAKPALTLALRQPDSGRVELSWNADDANLDVSTLRLEMIQGGSEQWQTIQVEPRAQGRTTLNVAGGGFAAVRGSIQDLAGNEFSTQTQLRDNAENNRSAAPSVPDFREPIATNNGPADLRNAGTDVLSPAPFADRNNNDVANRGGLSPESFISDNAADRPDVLRPQGSQESSSGSSRIVNTRRFQIGYAVEDVGPSGVGAVDLFITQDDGRKWYKYGEDPDRKSPFQVDVPSDGNYGFAIRVRSGAGLTDPPPRPSDKPEIVVVVDRTPPAAELSSPQQGRGRSYDEVLIRWRVTDEHPADEPVALTYAAGPNGPWQTISGWRRDEGSYVWKVQPNTPASVYVRISARDAAGNVTHEISKSPLLLDLSRPTARIVDVEATDGSSNPY